MCQHITDLGTVGQPENQLHCLNGQETPPDEGTDTPSLQHRAEGYFTFGRNSSSTTITVETIFDLLHIGKLHFNNKVNYNKLCGRQVCPRPVQ